MSTVVCSRLKDWNTPWRLTATKSEGIEPPRHVCLQSVGVPRRAPFARYVLDKVRREMDSLAARNLIDITFTYTPVYHGLKKRGTPDEIEFHVQKTPLWLEHKRDKRENSQEYALRRALSSEFGLPGDEVERIVAASMATKKMGEVVRAAVARLRQALAKQKPEHPASYCLKVLSGEIAAHTYVRPPEESAAAAPPSPQAKKLDPAEGSEQWSRVVEKLSDASAAGDKDYSAIIKDKVMYLGRHPQGQPVLGVAADLYEDAISAKAGSLWAMLRTLCAEEFGPYCWPKFDKLTSK